MATEGVKDVCKEIIGWNEPTCNLSSYIRRRTRGILLAMHSKFQHFQDKKARIKVVLGHMDSVKKCAKKIHDCFVGLGGFDNISDQADDIYFRFVRPVDRAFGNEETLEPDEEALVRRCTLLS